jgi:hypothetical protein
MRVPEWWYLKGVPQGNLKTVHRCGSPKGVPQVGVHKGESPKWGPQMGVPQGEPKVGSLKRCS